MTMKIGDAQSLSLNGAIYAVPKDAEPQVIKGGLTTSESQEYGDGTADPYQTNAIGKITGLKVKVPEELADSFKEALSNPSMPIVLNTVAKSYELTGYIVGEVTISTTRRISSEFEVHASDGAGVRES